ncbi:hypothetical protein DPMN_077846 [Dreissena polymorpha]|uniref:Uncharacterized protein n=2 Tax=Dreissena polymorpha TaxID=45954 RepID=A0A9D3YPE5_DREPO|nr:hypothetical protein DPMN_077846 [Dreissena polymorpha]
MHCKTSVNISRSSATYQWSLCKNITDQKVWCKLNGSSPFLSNITFYKWNDATDYCANVTALPSSANGYNDTLTVTTKAFTNIRREWTLHLANGSFSGPRMFAYIANGSTEIQFFNSSSGSNKTGLCLVRPPTTSTATSTTEIQSPTTRLESQTTVTPTSPNNSTTTSTTDTTLTNAMSSAAFEESSRGSSIGAIAAGVSVAVALVVTAVVIVLVLRMKGQLCFKNTKGSKLENTDNIHNISLERTESYSNANYINLGTPVFNHTNSCLQNTGTKDIHAFNSILDNTKYASYLGPDALVSSNSYGGQHTISEISYQNINRKQGLAKSDANNYFVVEKDGLDKKRNATTPVSALVHDYCVLEKQQSAVDNVNGASINEIHPYVVLEKQGDQPAREMPPNEVNPYFILEKQTACNSTTIHTANALILDTDDGNMYQEIDTNDTYAGIDDSRENNSDYDYTIKEFRDSKTDISDNVYNHLNSAGDEYDHLGKVKSNVKAMENNYDVTSEAVRK